MTDVKLVIELLETNLEISADRALELKGGACPESKRSLMKKSLGVVLSGELIILSAFSILSICLRGQVYEGRFS